MHHPQDEAKKENKAENLCAAFDRANGRWGHDANLPIWHPGVDLVRGSLNYKATASQTYSRELEPFDEPQAGTTGTQRALGRVRLSPRQQANYRQRTTGAGRL